MPCILLHRVGASGELKEVAQGTVVQPLSRDMHHTKMSEAVMKVRLTTVVPEFRDIDPPMQPAGADEHLVLGDCPKWVLDTSQTYLSFFMFHACFIPIATCFASTLCHFYTFFGTNLLTRC